MTLARFRDFLNPTITILLLVSECNAPRCLFADEGGVADVLESIVMISKATIDRIHVIEETVTLRQEPMDGKPPPPGFVSWMKTRIILDYDNDRFHYWNQVKQHATPRDVAEVEFAYQDGVETTYSPTIRQGSVSKLQKPQEDARRREQLLSCAYLLRPTPGGRGINDASLPSLLEEGSVLRGKKESINGHDCYVADTSAIVGGGRVERIATAWIDLECGALPIKILIYGPEGTHTESTLRDIQLFDDGQGGSIWLPTKVESLTHVKGRPYKITVEADPREVIVNPTVAVATFRVDFPPGVIVNDTDQKDSFRTPGQFLGSAEPSDAQRPRSSLRLPLILGGVGLIVLTSLLLRKLARRVASRDHNR